MPAGPGSASRRCRSPRRRRTASRRRRRRRDRLRRRRWDAGRGLTLAAADFLAVLEGREQGLPPLDPRLDLAEPRAEPLGLVLELLELVLGLLPVLLDEGPGVLLGVIVRPGRPGSVDRGRLGGGAPSESPGQCLERVASGAVGGELRQWPGIGRLAEVCPPATPGASRLTLGPS